MRPDAPPASSPALAAFLRGVERRAAVLAELQCGDAARGDRALAAAMAGFKRGAHDEDPAAGEVMATWPTRFWSGLLAHPELRSHVPVRVELSATDGLGTLGAGPRAALLLSLAAGLGQEEAAAVMGVSTSSYGLAVRRALVQLTGSEDQDALANQWRKLREQVHRRIKNLPAERQRILAEARAQALTSEADGSAEGATGGAGRPDAAASSRRPRWLVPVLWILFAVCVIAFVATFFGDALFKRLAGPGEGEVWSGALEQGDEPASRYDREVEVLTHRDFELLADPEGAAEAERLGFHSWLATQGLSALESDAQSALASESAVVTAAAAAAAAPEAVADDAGGETDHEPR